MKKLNPLFFLCLMVNMMLYKNAYSQTTKENLASNKLSDTELLLKQICPDIYKEAGKLYAKQVIKIKDLDGAVTDTTHKNSIGFKPYLTNSLYSILGVSIDPTEGSDSEDLNAYILAVFDKRSGKLLDALNIKTDQFTFTPELKNNALFKAGKNKYGILIDNHHFGGGIGYNSYSVFLISPSISKITDFFILTDPCFSAKPTQILTKNTSKAFYDIDLNVKTEYSSDCPKTTKKFPANLKSLLQWDEKKKKYIDLKKDLEKLTKFSESNR
jgi:hypothetical protein